MNIYAMPTVNLIYGFYLHMTLQVPHYQGVHFMLILSVGPVYPLSWIFGNMFSFVLLLVLSKILY